MHTPLLLLSVYEYKYSVYNKNCLASSNIGINTLICTIIGCILYAPFLWQIRLLSFVSHTAVVLLITIINRKSFVHVHSKYLTVFSVLKIGSGVQCLLNYIVLNTFDKIKLTIIITSYRYIKIYLNKYIIIKSTEIELPTNLKKLKINLICSILIAVYS